MEILRRPNNLYHVWHVCLKCGRVYDHSQGTWNRTRGQCCGQDLETILGEMKAVKWYKSSRRIVHAVKGSDR